MSSNEYTLRSCLKCGDFIKKSPLKCVGICDRVCHVRCSDLSEQQLDKVRNSGWRCDRCIEQSQPEHMLKLQHWLRQHEKRLEALEAGLNSKLNSSCEAPALCPFLPHSISRKAIIITGILLGLTIIMGALLAVILGKTPLKINDDGELVLVSVADWGGRESTEPLETLNLPVDRVIIAHTDTEGCASTDGCSYRARFIQAYHIDTLNWAQVGYNFMIGGDGHVYVGRGWDYVGAHTYGSNRISIAIAFIGNYNKIEPTQEQVKACLLLIAEGVRLKKLSSEYKIFGHRQLLASESPGDKLYNIIKTWPHFASRF